MPRPLVVPPHLSVAELERRYRTARDPVLRSHWQIVWLLAAGHGTRQVQTVTGYHPNWIREIARRYRQDGPDGLGDRRGTLPGARPLLDAGGRSALATALTAPPPDGGLWSGPKVARWMAARLGRPIHPQRGWEQLRALGWTVQAPRPAAVAADPAAQAAFKAKTCPPSSPR